jgi:hypothetical protein
MTLKQFTDHSANEQLQIIQERGVLIGKREHPHHYIQLFQVDAFYAEVSFRKRDDTVLKVGGLDHPILLEPYLNQLNISNLFATE